ncbi:uncharacterized protein BDW43DRAFT_292435 [Aspergillus alliaceus]|uniref:uncharacterized protein n=1 Tax=Petromyces alliaceus TaxID=209559 RepID=UPI0012A6947C|nr:uncharacterized protein BDW43DRAFT_292435 [Aspergillus alliaceus]KAB8228053.1 hypothetical protein BDW43DRAFT_292435 [Aspergillus alliaceus]
MRITCWTPPHISQRSIEFLYFFFFSLFPSYCPPMSYLFSSVPVPCPKWKIS